MATTLRRIAIRRVAAVAAAVAAGIFTAGSANAQLSQAWTWCVNKEKASPDLQVSGCTSVIQSGKETKKNLSIAFNNRGNGYRAKGDNDKAIADYTQAIRLDPKYSYPYNGRGNAYQDKKDHDALAEYNEAIRLDPKCLPVQWPRQRLSGQEGLRPRHRRIQPGDPPRSRLCACL